MANKGILRFGVKTAGYNKYRGWCKKLGHDLTNKNYDTVTSFADLTQGGALDSVMVDTLKNKAGYAVTIMTMIVHYNYMRKPSD